MRLLPAVALLSLAFTSAPAVQDVPPLESPVAVRNATVIPAAGQRLEGATVLIERGRIVAVGTDVVVPAGTREIDGTGLYAYPGFIDAFSRRGLAEARIAEEDERRVEGEFPSVSEGPLTQTVEGNRHGIFARRKAEDLLVIDPNTFDAARKSGFGAALVAPPRAIVGGRASMVLTGAAPLRSSVLRGGVAQTLSFEAPRERRLRVRGRYPATLLGVISHLRQFMLDAKWIEETSRWNAAHADAAEPLPYDPDLSEVIAALESKLPFIWEVDEMDALERAVKIADEFGLRIVIAGGADAHKRVSLLKSRQIPVILDLKLPGEIREYELKPEKFREDENDHALYGRKWEERPFLPKAAYELATKQREARIRNAQVLEEAGIPWCFRALDVKKPEDVLKSIHEMVKAGLPADAALRGLTEYPAKLLGLGRELGTLEKGRLGNVTLLTAPLGEKDAAVRYTIVTGRVFEFEAKKPKGEGKDEKGEKGRRGSTESSPASQAASGPATQSGAATASAPATGSAPATSSAPAAHPFAAHEPVWPIETDADRKPKFQTGGSVLLKNALVLTVSGEDLPGASVLVRDGRIAAVGRDLRADGVREIDLTGYVVMPGILDPHAHIAVDGVNEGSLSVTPEVREEDVIDSDDIDIYRALSGGTTSIHAMHGSANTIGGQCVLLKLKYGRPAAELVMAGAPRTVKWALGENVKRSGMNEPDFFRERQDPRRFPGTRMGVETTLRRALRAGQLYAAEREAAARPGARPLRRDLRLEALADILDGRIWVNTHCYRADEILRLMDVAEEFGIRIACLHHVLEGYRIMPEIARHGAGTATFADWWAYKMEAYDAVPHNAGMLLRAGVNSAIKSDSADLMRHMNLEAAKCLKYAGLSPNEALRLITLNAARLFGMEKRLGSIEVGKDADLAVFDGHPLDTFSKCVLTLVDGEVYFQHLAFDADRPPRPRPLKSFAALRPTTELVRERLPRGDAPCYAITNATLHPVSGPTYREGTLLIRDGRIEAAGSVLTIPPDAEVIDATGLHVYPGLINAATYTGLQEVEAVGVTIDTAEPGTFQPDITAESAFNPHSAMIEVARAEGTTTIALIPSSPTIAGQAGVLDLAGWSMGEMLVASKVGLIVNFPITQAKSLLKEEERPDEPNTPFPFRREVERGREPLQKLERFFRDAKVYAEGVRAAQQAGRPQPSPPDTRYDAMIPYVLGEKPVWFNVSSYQAILEAVQFADALGLRPVILGGREAWKVAGLLAERNIPVIYEGTMSMPSGVPGVTGASEAWNANYAALGVLQRAGVKLALCSRGADLAKLMPLDAGFAVAHGLDPDAAVRAMTLDAAEILGLGDRLGSLEPGKIANVIVCTDHPCQATNVVRYAFIRGRPVSLESKHTREAEKFGNRPRPALPAERTDLKGPPKQSAK